MQKRITKWYLTVTLGCLGCLTTVSTAHAGVVDAASSPHQAAAILALMGLMVFACMLVMNTEIYVNTSRKNGSSNGHNGNGNGNGHAHPPQKSNDESFYRDILEHVPDIIYTMDTEGQFTSLNPAGQRA